MNVKTGRVGCINRRYNHPRVGAARQIGRSSTTPAPTSAPRHSPSPLPPPPPPPPSQLRFDLLVPALIETFALLFDDGHHHLVAHATAGYPSTPTASLTGRESAAAAAAAASEHASAVSKNLGNRKSVNRHHYHRQSVSAGSALPPGCQAPARDHHRGHANIGGSTASPTAGAHVTSENTTREVALMTAGGKEEAARGAEGEREMVWEEHWDDDRQVPFYRLSGYDLSLWQIPAL